MSTLEARVARLEGTVEQINERLGNIEADMRGLRTEMSVEFREMRVEMRSNFRWLIGIIMVQWITVLGAVLGALLAR